MSQGGGCHTGIVTMTARMPVSAIRASRDRAELRAASAFALANARYWLQLAPIVHEDIARWEGRAQLIADPTLRAIALDKLREERFNVEAAAMFAAFAPSAHRREAARASVAVEVIYNYLDGLTERPLPDPLRDGASLFRALSDPFADQAEGLGDYYGCLSERADGGYLDALVRAARERLDALPAISAVRAVAAPTAARCGAAQVRMHASPFVGVEQLRSWATEEAAAHSLTWREMVAGAAASGVTLHALMAAAGDAATTRERALAIDALYLPVSAVSMMLDSLVDRERDLERTGQLGFIRFWPDPSELPPRICALARDAMRQAAALSDGAEHLARIAAIVSYYTSDRGARTKWARPIVAEVHRELRPLLWVTLPSLRAWRLARRLGATRGQLAGGSAT